MSLHDCQKSLFFNGGTLGKNSMKLIRNSSTTSCSLGFGVESNLNVGTDASDETKTSNAVFASKPIGSFIQNLNSDALPFSNKRGITMSLWIRPNYAHEYTGKDDDGFNDLASSRTIFTIGWGSFGTKVFTPSELTLCDKAKVDFQLSIIETNLFEIVYRTSDQIFEPCQRMEVNVSSLIKTNAETRLSSRPMHLTISLGNYHQEVFVNGRVLARRREVFDADLNHWNPKSLLQFFTYPTAGNRHSPPWEGQLFQFSVYGSVLDKNKVKTLISEGLPPSQPVADPKIVQIFEDALDRNGTRQQIQMPYFFFDDEMETLLSSLNLPHQPAAFVRHYITRFPGRGYLFHIEEGRKIEPSENLPVLVSNVDSFVFIPEKDEHSEFLGGIYTSFDYCVTTNKIIMSSQCTPATISVVVDPVNDPPVAIVPPLYVVHEGIQPKEHALLLTGSDVDNNDFIQKIQITSPPKMGHLFLSVSSFRKEDNLLHGTILEAVNNTIPGKEVFIEYQFLGYNTATVQGSLVMDFFSFRVQDSVGSWSSEAEVKIQVLSSILSPINGPDQWTVPMIKEGMSKQLKGIDASGLNRTIGFLIKSLPSSVVVSDNEGAPLMKNQIIKSGKSSFHGGEHLAWANVTLVGMESACTQSDNNFVNEMLRYQVVGLDLYNEVMSISPPKEEEITIVCGVEPLSMHFIFEEGGSKSISAFSSSANDICSGYMFDFTEESRISCRGTTIVWGLQIDNTEKLAEPVYAVINASTGGFLSLNQNHLSNIYALFDQPVMRTRIRFLVPAKKIIDVLSAIHFQSNLPGTCEIQITLQYGRCNHNETFLVDHEFSGSKSECYKTQQKIYVNVNQNTHQVEELSNYPFPWFPLFAIVVLGPIFYLKGKARQTVEEIHTEWKDEEGSIRKCDCLLGKLVVL